MVATIEEFHCTTGHKNTPLPHLKSLECLLLSNPHISLLQGHGTVAVVEKEQPLGRVHSEKGANVFVVGEGSRETHQTHHLLCGLDLTDGTSNDGLQDWTTAVV